MNINPETDLDLEKLFLPAWAQESPSINRYAKFAGEPAGRDDRRRGDRRGPRPPGREFGQGRRDGPNREGGRPRQGDRPGAPRRDFGEGRPPREDRGGSRRYEQRERREPPTPLPEINLTFVPDENGVDSLARQIRMTGRAYPLFQIALIILQKPERYAARFTVKKNAEGQIVQPLVVCALDDTLWLNEDEAVGHVLRKHFTTFYQAERTATEPPKGKYTFVAQCGMSGAILGPPNHHDYQTQLRKLHTERFSKMPFDVYKSRVRIVRDEEVVKKWVEEQSWKTEYVCLNVPEPLKLANKEDVEQHFRTVHKDTIIKPVESHTMTGVAARNLRCFGLSRLAREAWEDQKRFPLLLASTLSQQFASRGLQFFKVNKTVTHVSVARPSYLDLETTPVSEGVKNIVNYINTHPKSTRRKLMEALAPTPVIPIPVPAPVPATPEGAADAGQTPSPNTTGAAALAEPTPEQTAVVADLHWLIHQGHVIEFANGILETAKKPVPRPPKPERKPTEVVAATEAVVTPEAEPAPAGEAQTEVPSELAPQPMETPTESTAETSTEPEQPESAEAPEAPVAEAESIAEPSQVVAPEATVENNGSTQPLV